MKTRVSLSWLLLTLLLVICFNLKAQKQMTNI